MYYIEFLEKRNVDFDKPTLITQTFGIVGKLRPLAQPNLPRWHLSKVAF